MAVRTIRPGSNKAAEINAVLAAGDAVRLIDGTYNIETALLFPSSSKLSGAGSGRTLIVPTFSPIVGLADDPTNALIKIQGAADTSYLNTTISQQIIKDSKHIFVTAAGTLSANQWIRIQGNNTGGDALEMSDGSGVILTELLKVDSTYVSGTTVPLAAPALQHHKNGLGAVGVAPIEGVLIEGVDLAADGGTVAVGILCDYAVGVTIRDVAGAGFSRSLIELMNGTRDYLIEDIYSRGENNSIVHQRSAMSGVLRRVKSAERGKRFHANGIPRGLLTMRQRCTSIRVSDCSLQRGCVGIRYWGGNHLSFEDIIIRDMDNTEALTRDSTEIPGLCGTGVDAGAGPLTIAEFALDVAFVNVHLDNCRAPSEAIEHAPAWYLHDTMKLTLSSCSVINNGVSPFDTVNGQAYTMAGVLASDCHGVINGLTVKGVAYFLQTNNVFELLDCSELYFAAGPGVGTNGTIGILWDHNGGAGTSPRIKSLRLENFFAHIRFGSQFQATPDWQFQIDRYFRDASIWHNCVLAHNNTGTSFTTGDIVELDQSSPAGVRRVKTPAAANPRNAVVTVGGSSDLGTGHIMVSPLPATLGHVTATGAVNVGDLLEANSSRQAVVNNSPATELQILGRALTNQASGTGTVLVGPR